ncbi:unnamed protein product [Zymoseptoria tritici ST99CH_3D1]|nr:unnamed protein product [Zymoseptoria tritici ST99CH_3D1]
MAPPNFAIFNQARTQYRGTAQLHTFATDLGDLLEANARIDHLEENLTDRQKDRRRFDKIQSLEPKLNKQIVKLRQEIYDEERKVSKVQNETNQAEWWTKTVKGMTGKTGPLSEAEKLVAKVVSDFLTRFELPQQILDPTWMAGYEAYISDPTNKPTNPDVFETDDTAVMDLFANSNGLVQRHSSGRGYTIHSIVQFLQSAIANLSELRKSYTELEDQHAQDIESLMEDKESAVDEKETEVRDAKEEGQQWKNKYDELSSKHQSCEAVAQERDQLKEKETEFDTAIKRTAQLETDLQPLREEVERLKEDVEQEKSLRVKVAVLSPPP